MKKILLVGLYLLITVSLTAQKRRRLDSLLRIEKNIKQDTNAVIHFLKTAWLYKKINADSSMPYFIKAAAMANKINNKSFYLKAYFEKAVFLKGKGDLRVVVDTLIKATQLSEEFNNESYQITFNLELGVAYRKLGVYDKSIKHLLAGLKLSQKLNERNGIYNAYNSLANTYSQAGSTKRSVADLERALDCYSKAFDNSDKNNKPVVGMILNNKGVTYFNLSKMKNDSNALNKAIEYYEKSLKLRTEIKDSMGMSSSYNNLGSAYHDLSDTYKKDNRMDLATSNFEKAIEIDKKIKSVELHSNLSNYAGHLAFVGKKRNDKKLIQKSVEILKECLQVSEDNNDTHSILNTVENINYAYEALNMPDSALKYMHTYVSLKDTLLSEENKQIAEELAAKYESDLKDTENNNLKQQAQLREEVISKKSNTIKLMIAASVIMLSLIVMVFLSRQKINKSRKLIEHQQKETQRQKLLIEEKQKEIVDSINYSKRLQDAAIPSSDYFRSLLPQSFVFYKPKDIVAGDFYWIHEVQTSTSELQNVPSAPITNSTFVLVAAADCTGHGVPGALVSIVCLNALNRCVEEFKLTQPAQILDKASEIIQQSFRQSENDVKDGMDIALCLLDLKSCKGFFAGAHNPVWILNESDFREIKGDNQPVGQQHIPKPFTEHTFKFKKGDLILLTTDGYSDQFGGANGKKLKTKKFKEIFPQLVTLPISEVNSKVANFFEDWKGPHEQVDDVLVIGIRV